MDQALPSQLKGLFVHNKYRIATKFQMDERSLELYCFKIGWALDQGGLGKFGHFKAAAKLIWPDLQWNPWLERCIESLCDDRYAERSGERIVRSVAWTGCGAAGKTYAAGLYAMLWWGAAPYESIVTLTSTTKDMIGRRVWPVIQNLVSEAKTADGRKIKFGHLIDSQKILQFEKGKSKHAISALAVCHGETVKAVENLKGQHARRMLLIIDEANKTPEAIYETIPNMRKACEDLTILCIGNAVSHVDCHGMVCQPKSGWQSISVEDEEWPTKGVPKWQYPPGIALHFDGSKSPNVKRNFNLYPYLYSVEDWKHSQNEDYQDTLAYWSQDRGFWPLDGFAFTVMSESMIDRCDATGKLTFRRNKFMYASLDTAFGGNNCVFQLAEVGELEDGRLGIQLLDPMVIPVRQSEPGEADYQIARTTIELCKSYEVMGRNFGMDCTGVGRGVRAIISAEWSPDIFACEFNAAASDEPSTTEDARPGREVYFNRGTELWWLTKEYVLTGQMKGLYRDAIVEFTTRTYKLKGRRYQLLPKADCKSTLGGSPDHADAISIMAGLVKRNMGLPGLASSAKGGVKTWNRIARKFRLFQDSEPYQYAE